jgi:hypothetical protein
MSTIERRREVLHVRANALRHARAAAIDYTRDERAPARRALYVDSNRP